MPGIFLMFFGLVVFCVRGEKNIHAKTINRRETVEIHNIKLVRMKKVSSTAKATAATVIKVPQQIGRTILSVPQSLAKITNHIHDVSSNQNGHEDVDVESKKKLEFINREIVEDQGRKKMVRESQSDCMKEIVDHLQLFLDESMYNRYNATYEQWIAALHPDNAEYADGSIDHRFYVDDSDHRVLWNQVMIEYGCEDRVIQAKSLEPSYNRLEQTKSIK